MTGTLAQPSDASPDADFYRDHGYLHLRGFFGTEAMAAGCVEADRLVARPEHNDALNLRSRFQICPESAASVLDAIDPVIDVSPRYRDLAHDPRLLAMLHGLLGSPACLFKDKLLYRPATAPGQSLHQDFISWPGFPLSFTTVVIALDATTEENGCLEVFPGEHRRGYLSPEDGDYHDLPLAALERSEGLKIELAQGDILIFGGFLPHRSFDNRSGQPRRQLYLSYNALSDGGFQRSRHYREFHAWLRARYGGYSTQEFHFA